MHLPTTVAEKPPRRLRRWHWVVLGSALALLVLVVLFDWDWLRPALQRYISQKTQREFRSSHLAVELGLTPTIRLRDVYFANSDWTTSREPMARIGTLAFSVSLHSLFDAQIQVPHAAIDAADLLFEKSADGRRNWVLLAPTDTTQASRFRIDSLSVTQARLRYLNHGEPFTLDVQASSLAPPGTDPTQTSADPHGYVSQFRFTGRYHDAGFSGEALTGDVLSFQSTGVNFPIKARLQAGTTLVQAEGTVADIADISAIDVQLQIAGKTMASLYPFLLLPLPASPPYAFRGHLLQRGERYAVDDLRGTVGQTDMAGSAAYLRQTPRPMLTARLHSKLLNLADLGPLIGLQTRDSEPPGPGGARARADAAAVVASAPIAAPALRLNQANTNTRELAQASERRSGGDRLLPSGTAAPAGAGILPGGQFEGGRLNAIDAEVDYAAARLVAPRALPVEHMKFSFRLHAGVADLAPLEFGFAGGRIVSDIRIDAREPGHLRSSLNADFRHIQIAQLFPAMTTISKGVGEVGAQVRLQGTGNSIAAAAAGANGSVSAVVTRGRVSNLLDAIAGLNGGKVLALYLGGDKDIAVNCGGMAFEVKEGIGRSQLFVIDTEQTRIDGSGKFSLRDERLDFTVEPKPKRAGILSLRSPVHLGGSFRHPDFSLDKGQIALRAGAATALALINPFAALIPLIETGPGQATDCVKLLAPLKAAQLQATSNSAALAGAPGSAAALRPSSAARAAASAVR